MSKAALAEPPAKPARLVPLHEKLFQPLGNRVLIEPLSGDTVTRGGIELAGVSVDRQQLARGRVLAVGPGKLADDGSRLPMTLQAGDEVMYPRFCGDVLPPDAGSLVVMPEDNVATKVVCRS